MLCGQEALGGRADSPPPMEFTKESWRKDIGLQSPSSGTEVIYCSQEEKWEEECEEEREWYDESPEPERSWSGMTNRQTWGLSRPPLRSACTTSLSCQPQRSTCMFG